MGSKSQAVPRVTQVLLRGMAPKVLRQPVAVDLTAHLLQVCRGLGRSQLLNRLGEPAVAAPAQGVDPVERSDASQCIAPPPRPPGGCNCPGRRR